MGLLNMRIAKQQLTKEETELWNYIVKRWVETGQIPLRTEMANALNVSPQLAQHRLKRMQVKGWLVLLPNKKRNILLR